MNRDDILRDKNEQYIQRKMLEIEIARIKEGQAELELTAAENAINVDYLVCMKELEI